MKNIASIVYTIGYSAYPAAEQFINELKMHHINVLIDVRSTPYSAYYEQYNKDNLRELLQSNGIYYRNYAREFGARQEDLSFYKKGRLDFELFAKSEQFLDGVRKVENALLAGYIPVLMCAERDPIICHRAIMISRELKRKGISVVHIIQGENLLSQEQLEHRLIDKYFPDRDQISLFDERTEIDDDVYICKAYEKQNDRIGYNEEK